MNELNKIFGDVTSQVDNLCKQAKKICDTERDIQTFSKYAIKMNYAIETKDGLRRCGNCGKFFPLEEFKREKPGYDWKCKDCNKFDEAYK